MNLAQAVAISGALNAMNGFDFTDTVLGGGTAGPPPS